MKRALMTASVASMIDLFNMSNIIVLQSLGYEVHVACNFENGSITSPEKVKKFREYLENMEIKTFHIPIPRKIAAMHDITKSYKIMHKLIKENNYELVHCHSPIGGVIARLACRKYRKAGVKVIYTAHGFHFYTGASIKNWLLFYPIEKYCSNFTDFLITINEEDYNRAVNKFASKKNEYIPGIGVDLEKYTNPNKDRCQIRTKLGLNENDFVLINVGQLSKRKNQEVIIKSLFEIRNSSIKLLVCGFGELEVYYKNLVNELNLEENVLFLGYRSDISELLYASDCFVFPSKQEGLPVALMEAMAMGLPCVVSNIRGNSELIDDNKFLCNPNDYLTFIEPIKLLVADKELRLKKGRINQEKIKDFDIKVVEKRMREIYIDCINMK